MENDMTSKITTILAAAIVLASASVASAQTIRPVPGQWYAPYANSYVDTGPYANSYVDTGNLRYGHVNDPVFDAFGGTR
jgi:hypothetical protein